MTHHTLSLGAALATAVALSSCATLQVRTDSDPALLSSVQCHTAAWAGGFKGDSPLRNGIANPLNENRLRQAIATDLQARGITLTTANADCLIGYGIGSQRVADEVYPGGWAWGPGYWGPGWGWGWGWGWGAPYGYRRSYISVDLYDAKTRKPIWHATVDQDLAGLSGEQARHNIQAAVDAIFAKFPR